MKMFHVFEASLRLTLVKMNRQNGDRRKSSGYLWEKADPYVLEKDQ